MPKKKPYVPPQVSRHKGQDEIPSSSGSGSEGPGEVEGQFGSHVAPDFTTVVDTERRYIEVSDSFCQLLGYRRDDLIGKTYDEVSAPGTNDIPTVYRLFIKNGYMHGLWMLIHRRGTPILVRYEAWVRPDCQIQSNMELVRRLI
jgi:PAS domain S-box-containing protein